MDDPLNSTQRHKTETVAPISYEAQRVSKTALAREWLRWFIPAILWAPEMTREQLRNDLIAGIVIGVVFIPNVVAYASIIDAPLFPCLMGAAIFSLTYSLIGNTAALSMGPTAEVCLMLAAINNLPVDRAQKVLVYQSVSLQVGLLAIACACVQGGVIIRNSFARAVGDAFACAAGIVILLQQLKNIVNVKVPSNVLVHGILADIAEGIKHQGNLNSLYALIFFSGLFAYLYVMKHWPPRFLPTWFPHQVVVVIVAIVITWQADLHDVMHLKTLGNVPTTSFKGVVPPMDSSTIANTASTSVVIMLVGFLQVYSIGTKVSAVSPDANKELFTFGVMHILGGFFGGLPGASSFSRCAILSDLKVTSPLCSFIGAMVVVIAMAVLLDNGVFFNLPSIATSAILCAAIIKMVDFEYPWYLWKNFKLDFLVWLLTWILVMFSGVAVGILTGIGVAIIIVLFQMAKPPCHTVGYHAEKRKLIPISMDSEVLVHPGILLWQFDAPLYFINMHSFGESLVLSMNEELRPIYVVVVDFSMVFDIDASSVQCILLQHYLLQERLKVRILFGNVPEPIVTGLTGFTDHAIDPKCVMTSMDLAILTAHDVVKELQPDLDRTPVPGASVRRKKDFQALKVTTLKETALLTVVGVVAHADRKPKQKIKVDITNGELILSVFGSVTLTKKQVEDESVVVELKDGDTRIPSVIAYLKMVLHAPHEDAHEEKDTTLILGILELRGLMADLKFVPKSLDAAGGITRAVLACKWGGDLTTVGEEQSIVFAQTLASRIGMKHRMSVKAISCTEERVIHTAEMVLAQMKVCYSEAEFPPELSLRDDILMFTALVKGSTAKRDAELSKIMSSTERAHMYRYLHLLGLRELLKGRNVATSREALEVLVVGLTDLLAKVTASDITTMAEGEPKLLFIRRYEETLGKLVPNEKKGRGHFDVTPSSLLFDYLMYDIMENGEALSKHGITLTTLFEQVRAIHVVRRNCLFGFVSSERLLTCSIVVAPLLQEINKGIRSVVIDGVVTNTTPFPLYFTPSTIVDSLRTCIMDCFTLQKKINDSVRDNIRHSALQGYHYMTHIVFKGIKQSSGEVVVEVYLSSGVSLVTSVVAADALNRNPLARETVAPMVRIISLPFEEFEAFVEEITEVSGYAEQLEAEEEGSGSPLSPQRTMCS